MCDGGLKSNFCYCLADVANYLPESHTGKGMKPTLHSSHLSFMILALQLQIPLLSHVVPFEPSSLQLHSEIIIIVHQIFLKKSSLQGMRRLN